MQSKLRFLMLGDICNASGRAIFQKHIVNLKNKHKIDGIIVNGENSASDGKGITTRIVKFFKHNHVDVITSGNHIWSKRDIYGYLSGHRDLIRPANFPSSCPGVGVTTFECQGYTVGVMNLQARTFMREFVSCPFKTADSVLTYLKTKTNIILVDFHGEATSEKMAMGFYLDGQVSAVVGTHTHVQTSDERILPHGTAYITDLGMAGALNSLIGMKKEPIINQMITQMPTKYEVETTGPMLLTGVWIEVDAESGCALQIERIKVIDDSIVLDSGESD